MKHLKKIDELYKSTYLSAANQLKSKHVSRAKKMMTHAEERGTSELSKPDVVRLFPHPFVFTNNKEFQSRYKQFVMGKFYIVGVEKNTNLRSGYQGIFVELANEWGQRVVLELSYSVNSDYLDLTWNRLVVGAMGKKEKSLETSFLFDNRNDARQFIKFIYEAIEDLEMLEPPKPISINRLYYTSEEND